MGRSGHGELVTLCGLFLALFVGAKSFESVGLKADLGALVVGVLVGYHPKAKEISKSIAGITDLLLVGFFLQIGLEGALTAKGALWALLFLLLLPLKSVAFLGLLTRFRLRARTSWMASFTLSTYSEFGLIVMAVAVGQGWMSPDWLVAMAIALSLSILVAAPLSRRAEELYDPISAPLRRLETRGRHPDDLPVQIAGNRIAIFGMGRVGLAAYRALEARFPGRIVAFDRDPVSVAIHREHERNVRLADATDSDFWEKVSVRDDLDLVVLAMPKHSANVHAAETLKRHSFEGVVAATGQVRRRGAAAPEARGRYRLQPLQRSRCRFCVSRHERLRPAAPGSRPCLARGITGRHLGTGVAWGDSTCLGADLAATAPPAGRK